MASAGGGSVSAYLDQEALVWRPPVAEPECRTVMIGPSPHDEQMLSARCRAGAKRISIATGIIIIGVAALWGLIPTSQRPHRAPHVQSRSSILDAQVEDGRACVLLDGLRLENGGGTHSSVEAATATDCMLYCRGRHTCSQAIYSSLNSMCYMFSAARITPYIDDTSDPSGGYHSAICGVEGIPFRKAVAEAEYMMRQTELRRVHDRWVQADLNASLLVGSLRLEQKMSLVHGQPGGHGYAGFMPVWLNSYVMPIKMQDGPQGFNSYQPKYAGTSTQFPALLTLSATFNPQMATDYAGAVADEFVNKGSNVMLGPDVEVTRTVFAGRSFETLSGEDPFLGSELVRVFVKAVQDRGVISTVKHWLDNNQEIYRQTMTSVVGMRAQHEIYMPVFKAAFDAGAGAVMCSYNKVHWTYACENSFILKKLLREELGFKGFVVSDWGATHTAAAAANSGLDIEMPEGKYFKQLPSLIASGSVSEGVVDAMARHVISAMMFAGHFEGRFPYSKGGQLTGAYVTSPANKEVAKRTIVDGAVLLKNDNNALPLDAEGKTIAMIGRYCDQAEDSSYKQGSVYSGGGSGFVLTHSTVTPLAALKTHLMGPKSVKFSWDVKAAAGADVAVVCVAAHAEEGWDRTKLDLPEAAQLVYGLRGSPGGQDLKIVVVASAPGAIATEGWLEAADAVLLLFEPGEMVGLALADLLSGKASPGGRLPISLPRNGEQRFSSNQYPGLCTDGRFCPDLVTNFSEGTLVGYRWNDATGVPSAFPFGFGLTYTTFELRDLKVQASCEDRTATVSFKVANVGARVGEAVPQLYVGFPSLKPVVRQLRGFRKVRVPLGGEKDVVFVLRDADWSFYDEGMSSFVSALSKGETVRISVGSSSTDLPLSSEFSCTRYTS